MERKYFHINEGNARSAHDMMSMYDYKVGSTTADYHRMVDKAYDMADKVSERRPDESDRAYRLAERYSMKMAEYYSRESSIGMMCPSVMISGPANFPVKKKQRQVDAWQRNQEFYQKTQKILKKIENILFGRENIKSNDEKAIEKLEEKLEDLENMQKRMKDANKAIRMKDTETGNDSLREMGYSEYEIKNLREPDLCGRTGYPSYLLSNNNANINRIRKRIENLKIIKESGNSEQVYKTFKVLKNTEAMRYQIIFNDKPDADVRDILKFNGFKWSPSQGAWQRQITVSSRNAFNETVKKLVEIEGDHDE